PETAITNHLRHLRRAISTYIPADTLQVELDPAAPAPPAGTFFEGSVLIADISGFSSLTERLSLLGPEGTEALTDVVNAYFNAILAALAPFGASLWQFSGDA